MNVHLENVNLNSNSGPNHFASKVVKYLKRGGVSFDNCLRPDARLCFIESHRAIFDNVPLIQRLDGIYFNKEQDDHRLYDVSILVWYIFYCRRCFWSNTF